MNSDRRPTPKEILRKLEEEEEEEEEITMKYTIVIQWSEEDQCFIVYLPDFALVMQPVTHGDTYEVALQNAQEVLDLLIKSAKEEGQTLPTPKDFVEILQAV